jgi:PAS domain S-box-containing protein
VDRSLELPNGIWTLSVAPAAGWSDPVGLAFKSTLGVSFSLLLFFLTHSLLNTRAAALQIANTLTSELRAGEEKLRVIFDHTFQFIGLMSVDGTLIEANRSALEISGFRESEVIGKPFWETPWWAHSREMQEKLLAAIEKTARGEFVRFEATHLAIDGSLHYVDFSLKPVMDEDGNVVLLIPEGRDITDRKRVEELLRAREAELRAVVENSPDVIVRYDLEGRRIFVNPEFERVNHISAKEVLGKKPTEISTELAPMAVAFEERLMAAMESGTKTTIDLSWTKDGKPLCWYVRVVPEFDANGAVVSALTIWSDISERKQIEEAIRQLNEELEQRVKERTADLEEKNSELARLNKIFVGRELRMVELKERIRELEEKAGGLLL